MSNPTPRVRIRSELCTLAGISIDRFKYLARHEKLLIGAGYNHLEGAARSWRAFNAEDVVKLAVFAQATGAGGLSLDDALYAVGNGFLRLRRIANQLQSLRIGVSCREIQTAVPKTSGSVKTDPSN